MRRAGGIPGRALMILAPGQEVGRFVVEGVVGEGGMAVVYRVRHAQLGSVFALKLLSTPSEAVRRRMLNEGRIQATLRHPNIVSVVDVVEVNGVTGLLMEYIRGPSLEALLRQHRPSVEEAISLFGGVLAGVAAAHERGLIHRDLKPANVLLQPTEEGVRPKVTDFGIAKDVRDPSLSATRAGTTMGTPSYVAPEQIEDASAVDERADLWSLGCILYELLAGQKAFDGPNALRILNQVMSGDYIPLPDLEPGLPAHIVEAVDHCLKLRRDHRLTSCADLRLRLGIRAGDSLPTLVPRGASFTVAVDALTFQTPSGAAPRAYSAGPGTAAATQPMVSMLEASLPELVAEAEDERLPAFAVLTLLVTTVAFINAVVAFAFTPPAVFFPAADLGLDEAPVLEVEAPTGEPPEPPPDGSARDPSPAVEAAPTPSNPGPAPAVRPGRRSVTERLADLLNNVEEPPGTDEPLAPPPGSEPAPAGDTNPKKPQKPARIRVTGDAKKVMLTSRGEYWSTSQRIPPGTYDVVAWFDSPEPLRAGTVTLEAGQRVRIVCTFTRGQCYGETE